MYWTVKGTVPAVRAMFACHEVSPMKLVKSISA